MHGIQRTGVRFVLSNCADRGRLADFNDWYDAYGAALAFPGLLVNCLRFENLAAAGTDADPTHAALYDFVTPDLEGGWPQTEHHPDYPKRLFDNPGGNLVEAPLRATYALVGERAAAGGHGALSGVTILLSDGPHDYARDAWGAALVKTGLFYAVTRFRIVEGLPDPPGWMEVLETDRADPLAAYAQAMEKAGPPPQDRMRIGYSGSFRFYSASP